MLSPPLIYRRVSWHVGLAGGSGRNGHTGKNPDRSRNVAAGTHTRVPDVARFLRLHALTHNLHCRSRYRSGFLGDRWPMGDAGRGGGRALPARRPTSRTSWIRGRATRPSRRHHNPAYTSATPDAPPSDHLFLGHTARSPWLVLHRDVALLCCCTRCCKASQIRCRPPVTGVVYPHRFVDEHLHSSRSITIYSHLL